MSPETLQIKLDALTAMCRSRMEQWVLGALAAAGRPLTSVEIAEQIDIKHEPVQRAICQMYLRRRLAADHVPGSKPRWVPVGIGPCEWCGLVDHHLVAGECPACREKVRRQQEVRHA